LLSAALLWASPSVAGDFAKEDLAGGEKLYRNRCAKCHKMYDPARYTDPQWDVWMQKMAKKARLKPDQKQALTDYVEATLRHPEASRTNGPATAQR